MFFKDLNTYFSLLKKSKDRDAFFFDNETLVKNLIPYIEKKKHKKPILIFFEDTNYKFKEFEKYILKTNFFRTLFFLTHKIKTLYSSSPGLNKTIFSKSLLSKTKYIYLQHSPVSLTMAYPDKYFDEFDAIQVINKSQYNEILEIKKLRNLKCKVIRSKYLYLKRNIQVNMKNNKYEILIAPSWNTGFYKNKCHILLDKYLKDLNLKYLLRPHHMSFKKKEVSINELESFDINFDQNSEINHEEYKLLISDWSGIIYESAILKKKKALLVNTAKKINNSNYKIYENIPLEVKSRQIFGYTFNLNELENLSKKAQQILKNESNNIDNDINNFINENFFV